MKSLTALAIALSLLAGREAFAQVYNFNGHTYQLTTSQKDWQAAEAEAVTAGGHLIAIGSQAEQDFVVNTILPAASLTNRPVWIGFSDHVNEGIFRWSNGEPVVYTAWQGGPDDYGGIEDYVALNWHHAYDPNSYPVGTWNDAPLNGSTIWGASTDGPYYGIIEIGAPQAGAPQPTTWAGGSGNWSDPTKWSNGIPNSFSADAIVDDQPGTNSNININNDVTVGRLRVDAGDSVAIAMGVPGFTISDTAFLGAGELLLNGQFQVPGGTSVNGPKMLNGTGKFVLGSSPTLRPEITGVTFNNVTIEGTANFGRYNNGSYPGTIINTGVVNANMPGAGLYFNSAFNSSNSNLIEATNGSLLSFNQGSITNTGEGRIVADGVNSIVHFNGFSVTGGTLEGKNGGVVTVGGGAGNGALWQNLTLAGTASMAGMLRVDGTVTIDGTITVPSGSIIDKESNTDPVTLAGTGTIVLDGENDLSPELISQGYSGFPSISWTFDHVTVRGRGDVGYKHSSGAIDNVIVTNQGTFQADVDGKTLIIDVAGFDNRNGGRIRAINGGILRLAMNGKTVQNFDGTIEALDGGRIETDVGAFTRIEGGLLRNIGGFIPLGGMAIVNPGTGMRLEGDLTIGESGRDQEAAIIGAIDNKGILRIAGSTHSAVLRVGEPTSPAASLIGGGQIILGDPVSGSTGSALMESPTNSQVFTLTNVDNTIRGFGRIGEPYYQGWMSLKNESLIVADEPGKILQITLYSGDNSGSAIRATNEGLLKLRVRGGINNIGGRFESEGAGSTFSFHGDTQVTGGLFLNTGGNFELGNATMINPGSGFTLQGAFVQKPATNSRFIGNIRNEGSIRLRSDSDSERTRLSIGSGTTPDVMMTGGGELILGSETPLGSAASIESADGAGTPTLTLENQNLRGFGVVGYNSGGGRGMNLINNSLINADVSGKRLSLVPFNLTNNPGKTMKATNGGELYFHPLQLNNANASILAAAGSHVTFDLQTTLSGGTVSSAATGTLNFPSNFIANSGAIFANAGTTVFGEAGATRSFDGLSNGGSSFINSGTIRKINSGDYSVFTSWNNTGAVDVQQGVLRFFGGGTMANASFAAAMNSDFTLQGAVAWNISGVNNFTGPGRHWTSDTTLQLADAATQLNYTNFNSVNTTFNGPGTINASASASFPYLSTTVFAGPTFITDQGSSTSIASSVSLQFQNSSKWVNSGAVTISTSNPISGTSDTMFTNTATGRLSAEDGNEGLFDMPYENRGTFSAGARRLRVQRAGVFRNGKAEIANPQGIYFHAPLDVKGAANTSTGAGFLNMVNVPLTFDAGAKLSAERIAFGGISGATGGEVEVSAAANFTPASGQTSLFDRTQVRLLAGSVNSFPGSGTLRLQNDATLGNAGSLNIHGNPIVELNSGAVLENTGTLTTTAPGGNAPRFTGDGSGLFRTLSGSITRFYYTGDPAQHFVSVPFDFAGEFYAEPGVYAVFDHGGLLNETAKISASGPSTTVTFTGPTPLQSRGRAVEFPGTGYVNFVGTTLEFLPSTLSSTGNGELDESSINAGARVAFHGDNLIKSSQALIDLDRQGTLNSSGLVFQNGDQIVDNAILKTSGPDDSVWNATGRKLTLLNGAKFLNTGRFVIQSRVGSGVAGDPGITGDNGTLFHNTSTGRLIHDTNTRTDLNVDFQNDGVLEFRAGEFNFLKNFSGNGGLAASNGAQVNLSLAGVPGTMHPNLLQTIGTGSQINVTLAGGQVLSLNIDINGGTLVAAGGLNMVAAGGLNMVAAGGGNLVAAGGMNLVAAGGGNIIAGGPGTLISTQGGDMIGLDGGTLIGNDGSTLAALNGGNLIGNDGSTLIGNDGSTLIGLDGGSLIGNDGSTLIGNDGSTLVAAGGGNIAIGSGVGGRSGKTAAARTLAGLAVSGTKALLTTTAGANVKAIGGGSIIAHANGVIMGSGTFTGPGVIENGGALVPGHSAGTLNWNGDLAVQTGGLLDIEIGGTTSGTQYDRVNVSGSFTLNGVLNVRMLNSFGGSVQPTDVFDIVVAGSPISTGLTGTRVAASGSYGSFAVELVNGGNTLRLTDFQAIAPTFNNWASRYNLTGADADPMADPNHNGISNLMEYALGLDPTVGGSTGITSGLVEESAIKYQTLSYTKPTGAEAPTDILYEPQRASTLVNPDWSSSLADVLLLSTVPGPGNLETVTVRSTHPISSMSAEFLRLKVTMTP